MPLKIINALSDANNSIAESLKSVGQSIWGDEAKNEGLRQNAEKLRRENAGRQGASEAFRRGDLNELGAQGILGGMSAGDASGYGLYGQANKYGAQDQRTTNAFVGAGHPYAGSYHGFEENEANKRAMEEDRTNASRYTPVLREDRYGEKSPAGAFNTRTGGYQPFGQPDPEAQPPAAGPNLRPAPAQPGFGAPTAPSPRGAPAPGGTPQVGYQPAAAYDMPAGQPTGGEYLQTLPPGQASLIVSILDGRAPPPTGNALLAKRNQHLLEDLALVEPGFDLTKWVERYKTAQDFSSGGKSGQAVKSANQAVTHLGRLTQNAEGLHNSENLGAGIPVVGGLIGMGTQTSNTIKNAIAGQSGEVGTGPFDLDKQAFADEISKVFRTVGMSDHEIEQWGRTINSSQSPTQLKANIAEAMHLYHGAVDALEESRARGMGGFRKQEPLLSPGTQDTLGRIESWTRGGKWQPAPAQAGPQPATALPPGPTGHPPSFNDRFESAQPGAPPQAPPAAAQPSARITVRTPQEAHRLAPGTHYFNPNGDEFVR